MFNNSSKLQYNQYSIFFLEIDPPNEDENFLGLIPKY